MASGAVMLAAAPAASAEGGFGPDAEVTRSDDTGKVVFVATEPGSPLDRAPGVGPGAPAVTAGLTYLEAHADALGIAGDELSLIDASSTPGGGFAVHSQQNVDGVPVLAGELIVNLTSANEVLSVSGEAAPIGRIDTYPAIGREAAAEAALASIADRADVAADELEAAAGKLYVYDPNLFGDDGGPELVWSVDVSSERHPDVHKQVLIDAADGSVAHVFELVHNALNRRVCDNANTRGAANPCTSPVLTEGGTYGGGVAEVNSAYDFNQQVYDFYFTRWNRDSLNGAGLALNNTVRFCDNATNPNPSPPPPTLFANPCPFNNAFWNGAEMYYGQGWANGDDLVGHELTHGVTQFESALVYQNESGAINESLSDVFGEALDLSNGQGTDTAATRWQLFEDSPGGPYRDMEDPAAVTTQGAASPDKMTSSNWWFQPGDNGGVHFNSGVGNKAAFLLTDGQTFNTFTVSPIGLEKTVRIFYEAQTNILTGGSDYGALGNALNQACTNLVGTAGIVAADCTQVNNAVLATEMLTEAAAPDTTIASGPGETDDPTPTWTFSGNRAGATFECSIDQGTAVWAACSGPGASHTPASDLADGSYTFRVRGRVGANIDPTPATRDFTVSTADMELVSKADGQDPAFAGETLTYTIRARNNGPGTAEDARVVDVLPEGTTYESSSIPCTESPAGTLSCGLGDLADDQERTITITVSIDRELVHEAGAPLTITNKATADSDRNDRDASNDEKSESTLVKAKADVEIVSFAAASPPAELIVGQPATVTLEKLITNNGPSAPMDVRVARTAAASSNATVSPASTSHVEAALGYQERRAVDEEFEIACTRGGPATFTFTNALSPDRPDDIDPDTSNNNETISLTVECIVPVAINIAPGSFRNPIELDDKKGEVPVDVLTTRAGEYGLPLAFDATTIRPLTVRFGPKPIVTAGGGAQETHRRGHIEDALERSDEKTMDGDRDMLLHFGIQQSGFTGSEVEACVRGRFGASNVVFQGCDSVTIVP
ncbi:MAG TPA: M4 family metallopeptidase [Acidimicrobiia bacterium]|nr:M4 family metallopeptidase [Acidimicrobiia bacterium]